MIKSLYPGYFQKSRVFLYPLLNIKKEQLITPDNTYLTIEGRYTIEDRKLIMEYTSNPEPKGWLAFKNNILFKNRTFERIEISPDGKSTLCIFDFTFFKEDYDFVVNGKYSKMSTIAKSLIKVFYGKNSLEWEYMESFLMPSRYYILYAELLAVEVELLEKVVELASYPNFERENLKLEAYLIKN